MDTFLLLSDSFCGFVLLKIVELILLLIMKEGLRLGITLRVVELERLLILMREVFTLLGDDWLRMFLMDYWLFIGKSGLRLGVVVVGEEFLHFFNYYISIHR